MNGFGKAKGGEMYVSTGEPEGGWKRFGKILKLYAFFFGSLFPLVFLIPPAARPFSMAIGAFAILVLVLWKCPTIEEQRFKLLIDRHPVRLTLSADASRRTWLEWESGATRGRACILEAYGSGWVDYPLELDGRCYLLRILIKSYRGGHLISNWGRDFEMVVVRNTYVF